MLKKIKKQLAQFQKNNGSYRKAGALYRDGCCQILSQSGKAFDVLISAEEDVEIGIEEAEEGIRFHADNKDPAWNEYAIAALMQVKEELEKLDPKPALQGKVCTREGMIKRVLNEREEKAAKANYKIKYADNIYGEHILINEKGTHYKITLRDFESETGYIDNPDWKTNKLGTTKHIMYAFERLKTNRKLYNKLSKKYPFVEIYLDPLNEYRITWHYPHPLSPEIARLIKKYFGKNNYVDNESVKDFLLFIRDANRFPQIVIRQEVEEKVRKAWDAEMLQTVQKETELDFSLLKVPLFSYQQEGVAFATFREGAIIADEMGLGKTIQAVATAVMKKAIFGFRRTLIICPASLKEQWRQEIKKFSNENAEIVDGFPEQRTRLKPTLEFFSNVRRIGIF